MDIPHKAHVVAVDGRKLLMFRNDGSVAAPKLTVVDHDEHYSPRTSDQGSDEGGSTFSSNGGRRAAPATTDFHQLDEDGFGAAVAEKLRLLVNDRIVDRLIIVAAPHTLGVMRKHYDHRFGTHVVGEISKDVTGLTTDDILRSIASS